MDATLHWNGNPNIPTALRVSHDEARAELVQATMEDGPIAEAAHRLAQICLPHFEWEEQSVFPVLRFLPELAQGILRPEMADILPLVSEFSLGHEEYFNAEHQAILSAINSLLQAARRENNREFVELAYNLRSHEKIEDQVVYPTVMLVGNYLREKLLN